MLKYLMLAFIVPGGLAILVGILIYKISKEKKQEALEDNRAPDNSTDTDIPMMGGLAADIGHKPQHWSEEYVYTEKVKDTYVSKKTVKKKKTAKRLKKTPGKKKTSKK